MARLAGCAVFRATWRGASVACKRLKPSFAEDMGALTEMRAELAIWCRLQHPNICQFLVRSPASNHTLMQVSRGATFA